MARRFQGWEARQLPLPPRESQVSGKVVGCSSSSAPHTHACAHARMHANICACIYISMRAHPHTIHMHTLSPEVERPPRLSGDPLLHHPSRASLSSSPNVSSAESPPGGSHSYLHHRVCFRVARGRVSRYLGQQGGRTVLSRGLA